VTATRSELARLVGLRPAEVSEIMSELEAVRAVHRRRDGRGVRYFVSPWFATHRGRVDRERAQWETPYPPPLLFGRD
jgi:predicted transcriptional regulator